MSNRLMIVVMDKLLNLSEPPFPWDEWRHICLARLLWGSAIISRHFGTHSESIIGGHNDQFPS